MNKLEELHIPHAKNWDCYNDEPLKENHALASALITTDIATKFSEWLQENRWFSFINNKWHYTFEMGTSISEESYNKNYTKTTEQLFNKFLETL